MSLIIKSASELSLMLEKKQVSSLEILNECYKRTDETDGSIGAYLTIDQENAIKTAKGIDDRRAKGEKMSPLAGIPVAIKDNICTKNLKTTCASKILDNFISPYDATVIEKIHANDMIITGKLNMDEFAMGSSCENSAFGLTRNPHDLKRVPGGSSGGSAAVVASGQVPLSLGSDTGGSIRQPAAFTGTVGLKPTYGSVSRYGLVAFASSFDQIGPFSRSVSDSAMLMDVICGYDPLHDSTSVNCQGFGNFKDNLNPQLIRGLKIGIADEYFTEGISDEVKKSVMSACDVYKSMGARIEAISLPMIEYALSIYYILSSAEASSNLARFDGVKYGYRAKDASDLVDLYVKSRSEGFGQEVQRRIMLGNYVLSSGYYDAYYNKAKVAQRKIKEEFQRAFLDCDVILTPATPTTAFEIGAKSDPLEMYMSDICTVSVNIAGLPAIVLPCGKGENNMPIGMQLIGKHFDEQMLFNTALAFENQSGIRNLIGGSL